MDRGRRSPHPLRRGGQASISKREGEVDAVRLLKNDGGPRFQPIEVKWTTQIRAKDLKQVRKYANGTVWARHAEPSAIPPVLDLVQELAKIR